MSTLIVLDEPQQALSTGSPLPDRFTVFVTFEDICLGTPDNAAGCALQRALTRRFPDHQWLVSETAAEDITAEREDVFYSHDGLRFVQAFDSDVKFLAALTRRAITFERIRQ